MLVLLPTKVGWRKRSQTSSSGVMTSGGLLKTNHLSRAGAPSSTHPPGDGEGGL